MTALKLFTTIMKVTLLPSLFKAVALTALAYGTLALTSISLSSCGGGGSGSDTNPDAQVAKLLATHKMTLDGEKTLSINFVTHTTGVGRNTGTARWGDSSPYNCIFSFSNTTQTNGGWRTRLQITINSSGIGSDEHFKAFYGQPGNPYPISVSPIAFTLDIPGEVKPSTNGSYTPVFPITVTPVLSTGSLGDPFLLDENTIHGGLITFDQAN